MPGSFAFTDAERALLGQIPEDDLIVLVADLDLEVPEVVQRDALLVQVLDRLGEVARAEGLPISRYDREELAGLPPDELRALADACGCLANVDALIKMGERVYKRSARARPGAALPLLLPSLLAPLARRLRTPAPASDRR
jgi:hypothetical protein